MDNTPGYGGPQRSGLSGKSGTADGLDATLEAGNYGNELFGVKLPQGTGSPGSQGATGAADPTNQPGQLNEGLSGEGPAQTAHTGAPGSEGVQDTGGGGADTITFTAPGSFLTGTSVQATVTDDVSGPNDWTQASDGLYTGKGNLPGIPEAAAGDGLVDTGAGGGRVMRGGNSIG